MRLAARRVAIVLFGGFAITFMLVSLPTHHAEGIKHRPYRTESHEPEAPKPLDVRADVGLGPANLDSPHFSLRKLKKNSDVDEGKRWWPQQPLNEEPVHRAEDIPGPLPPSSQDPSLLALKRHLEPWRGKGHLACTLNDTFGAHYKRKYGHRLKVEDSWDRFFTGIGSCDMYRENEYETIIADLIHDLRTLPIKNVEILGGGTQVKLMLEFEGGKYAAFKPMRFSRQYETDPNHFYFSDFERHNAEIAAFHLDRVLGIRHAIPTTGRVFNLSSEIEAHAEHALNKTFFISPFKNLCFVSKCDYYCDTTHAICGRPHLKEASIQVFLPDEEDAPRDHARSPYRRTYSKRRQIAEWQTEPGYCDAKVKTKKSFAHGTKLINLVEMSIFDFLTGNQDRHHFEGFSFFENSPYPIFFDNGRAFGRPMWDDADILAPLRQCCLIRPSLLSRLLKFYTGPESLSQALWKSMSPEPVAPILALKHYPALERRLLFILESVRDCIATRGAEAVIMYEYHNPDVDPNAPEDEEETEEPRKRSRKHRHRRR